MGSPILGNQPDPQGLGPKARPPDTSLSPHPLCRGSGVRRLRQAGEGGGAFIRCGRLADRLLLSEATQGQTRLKPLGTCSRVQLGGFWDKLEVGMMGKRPSQDSRPEGLGLLSFRTARLDTTSSPSPAKHVGDPGELVGRIVPLGTSSPLRLSPGTLPGAARRGGAPSDAPREEHL